MSARRRYRFGPLEEARVLGPLRPTQVVVLAAAGAAGLAAIYALGQWVGMALAIAAVAGAGAAISMPIEGRTLDRWAPIALRWGLRSPRRRHGFRSALPGVGFAGDGSSTGLSAPSLPPELADLQLLEVPYGAEQLGVIWDRAAGTYTATIAVRAGAFGLRDGAEQERKLDAWGEVLSSLARDGSPVRRLQWIERTLPARSDELAAYLQAERDRELPLDSNIVSSYIELIEAAAPAGEEHEILLALQISERLAARELRRLGGGQAAACEILIREAESLAEQLSLAELTVIGLLSPGRYAETIRDAFDPFGRQARSRATLADPDLDGVDPSQLGPLADQCGWSYYRTDSTVHRTYWISGWPQMDVGPAFLAPLLMQATMLRTVSVTIEPIAHSTALRKAEAARTAEIAEEMQRERQGFITTARVRRRAQAASLREEELADGHGLVRLAGYVSGGAASLEQLERRGPDLEHAGQRARLTLQPLYGEQEAGFTFTLPLCRGLA
jgi:hypothetical protein